MPGTADQGDDVPDTLESYFLAEASGLASLAGRPCDGESRPPLCSVQPDTYRELIPTLAGSAFHQCGSGFPVFPTGLRRDVSGPAEQTRETVGGRTSQELDSGGDRSGLSAR